METVALEGESSLCPAVYRTFLPQDIKKPSMGVYSIENSVDRPGKMLITVD